MQASEVTLHIKLASPLSQFGSGAEGISLKGLIGGVARPSFDAVRQSSAFLTSSQARPNAAGPESACQILFFQFLFRKNLIKRNSKDGSAHTHKLGSSPKLRQNLEACHSLRWWVLCSRKQGLGSIQSSMSTMSWAFQHSKNCVVGPHYLKRLIQMAVEALVGRSTLNSSTK